MSQVFPGQICSNLVTYARFFSRLKHQITMKVENIDIVRNVFQVSCVGLSPVSKEKPVFLFKCAGKKEYLSW